ncbi:MAG: WD40 repeat domain-containing protein [Gemmataceae bacterium]|nr:WD40 repeat domain-containing protein [Gemmataceae bacterium]MCI0739050.1 WD40 repeat domain-containing protein [Gemmataceae bacterium]
MTCIDIAESIDPLFVGHLYGRTNVDLLNGAISIVDLRKQAVVSNVEFPSLPNCIKILSKGDLFLAGGGDGKLALYRTEGTKQEDVMQLPGPVYALAVGKDGKTICVGMGTKMSFNGGIALLDLAKGTCKLSKRTVKEIGTVFSIVHENENDRFCIGGEGTISIWDVDLDKKVVEVKAHESGVAALAIAKKPNYVASGSFFTKDGSELNLWSYPELRLVATAKEGNESMVGAFFADDDSTLYSAFGKSLKSALPFLTAKPWQFAIPRLAQISYAEGLDCPPRDRRTGEAHLPGTAHGQRYH